MRRRRRRRRRGLCRSTICGRAARTVRQTPSMSTAKTRSHSSPAIPLAVASFCGRDPGVGDDDVEAAEALDRLRHRAHHRPIVGDVGADPDRPLADPLGGLARLLGVEVEHRDRGAAHLQLPRGLVADPARGAGDQRHLSVQVEGRHRPAAYWSEGAIRVQSGVRVESAYSEFAEARGLERVERLDTGPLTPLLVESKSCTLEPAVRGRFSATTAGVAGQLSYTRNKTFRFNVALTQVPAVDRVRSARLLHPPGPPDPRRRVLRLRGARLETLDRERRPQRALPGQHEPVPRPELAAAAVRAAGSSTGSAPSRRRTSPSSSPTAPCSAAIEEDEPTPAALEALCDATAPRRRADRGASARSSRWRCR